MNEPNAQRSRLARPIAGARAAAFAAWTVFILIATLMSDPTATAAGGRLAALLAALGIPEVVGAKAFHFAAYALWMWLLTGLLAAGYRRPLAPRTALVCVALLLGMSATQEALQYINPTRHPALFDFGVNMAGGLACLGARPWMARSGGRAVEG